MMASQSLRSCCDIVFQQSSEALSLRTSSISVRELTGSPQKCSSESEGLRVVAFAGAFSSQATSCVIPTPQQLRARVTKRDAPPTRKSLLTRALSAGHLWKNGIEVAASNERVFSAYQTNGVFVINAFVDGDRARYTDLRAEISRITNEIRQSQTTRVVIELSSAIHMTSVAIGAMVKIARDAGSCGADVCLSSAPANVLHVLETMNLTNLWPHYASLELAIAGDS